MDLSTSWMGQRLATPFVAGAGPFADDLSTARRVAEAGASAIVLRSLFEEQLSLEAVAALRRSGGGAWASPLDERTGRTVRPEDYALHLERVRTATGLPVFASLNGTTAGAWLSAARVYAQAGAAGIELNLYQVLTDPEETAVDVESRAIETVRVLGGETTLPVAVKLSPFHTALPGFVRRLADAGAVGFVLFNRYYEPDVDLDALEVRSHVELSSPRELSLRLRWLAILSPQVAVPLAVSGGVHAGADAVKAILCGATVVQMVSSLLLHGPAHLRTIRDEVVRWMEAKGHAGLADVRGALDLARCPDPTALARAAYMHGLQAWSD